MKPGIRTAGPASLELVRMVGFEDKNLLEVKSVRTEPESRNKGYAGQLLDEVCKEADESRTLLVLAPEPYDDGALTADQLSAWYAKNGFASIDVESPLMCRDPVVSVH